VLAIARDPQKAGFVIACHDIVPGQAVVIPGSEKKLIRILKVALILTALDLLEPRMMAIQKLLGRRQCGSRAALFCNEYV
jgi:hypothetical protein